MSGVISALTNSTTGITSTSMFGVVQDIMPLVLVLIPLSLGLYFLRKVIKGAGKGKVRF